MYGKKKIIYMNKTVNKETCWATMSSREKSKSQWMKTKSNEQMYMVLMLTI